MYRNDNDARYAPSYRQTQLSPAHHRAAPSVVGNARYVHDVRSTLPARALPSKDLNEQTNRWDRHPAYDNYERRNSPPYYHPSATLLENDQTDRHAPPMRQYAYTTREVDHEKPDLSVRREYSPPRKERSVDGSFRGFTTAFPGCETGRRNENLEDDVRRRPPYHAEMRPRSPPNQRYASHMSSAPIENLPNENDSRYRNPYSMNYNVPHQPSYNHSSANDYPREPYRPMIDSQNGMRGPSEQRYSASEVGSSISQRGRRPAQGYHDRRWEDSPQYGHSVSIDPDAMSPNVDQSRLSPRTFQRECQKAYYEARNQRMRNLEEGLYGKCKWATYDSKYC